MFKQLKRDNSTISSSSSTSSTCSNLSETSSLSSSSSIKSNNQTNLPEKTSSSESVLQVLKQQRRQNKKLSSSSSSNATLIQKLNESKKVIASSNTTLQKNNKKPSTNTTLPITARKKIKPTKAVGEGVKEEDENQVVDTASKEEDTLIPAAEETSVMAPDVSEVAVVEGDELDAEGEEEIVEEQVVQSTEKETEEEDDSTPTQQNVVVCVRVRPTSKSDSEEAAMWNFDGDRNKIIPTEQHPTLAKRNTAASTSGDPAITEDGSYDFSFDSLVLPTQSADEMFSDRIAPIVNAVIKGYNGTVFAYGQTGSGKTYTMSGSETEKGVIPKAVHQIFDNVSKASSSREFLLRVSYLEIYNESLNDLLASTGSSPDDVNGRPSSPIKGGSSHMVTNGSSSTASSNGLRMFESAGRLQIQGLREEIVTDAEQVLNLLEKGQNSRHQAATDWNERSSRSHCVFMLTVESRSKENKSKNVRISQLNLIDLAGSERAASEKERRKEGAFINKSLLTLGTVIAKLSEQCASGSKEQHIPYRDSKLTRLLQSSLGGNARVAVVCTLSARKEHAVESLSTLRFGSRCKMVTTRAKQGSVVDDKALIARYKKELETLRAQLESNSNPSTVPVQDDESIKALHQKRKEAERDVMEMNGKRSELKKQIEHLTRLILTGKEVEQQANLGGMEEEEEVDRTKRIRASRRSDLGTSSPSKGRNIAQFLSPFVNQLTPLRPSSKANQENSSLDTPLAKPFALESELAQLRKSLSKALTAKQASEEARKKEVQLWQAKVAELEESNREQEEELDEAEEAFKKLQSDRDTLRMKVGEEQEANRLLKLVARSRTSEQTEEQKKVLFEKESEIKKLKIQLEKVQNGTEDYTKQLKVLQEKLLESDSSSSKKVAELEKEIEALRKSSANGGDDDDDAKSEHSDAFKDASQGEVELLRERLRISEEEKEKLEKELRQNTLDRGQEDAERDFAELMVKNEKGETIQKELQSLKIQLEKQTKENEEQKSLIEELKANNGSKPLPVPSLSPSSLSMNDDLRTSMEKQLRVSEERCKTLEKQMEIMSSRSIPSPPLSTSSVASSSSSSSRSPALVELQIESDIQRSRIASLERQLAEARARVQDSMSSMSSSGSLSLPGSPIKWSSSRSNPATPIKRTGTLDNVREEESEVGDETIMLHAGPYSSTSLGRRGSLLGRTSMRYSGSRNSIGGDLAIPSQSTTELERQLKQERDEIVRLNGVISTQRAIMTDLESSVATWKKRLRTQQEIITKLVEAAGVKASPSLLAQTQNITSPTTTSAESSTNVNAIKAALLQATQSSSVELKRTSSTASTSSTNSPYYGAHLYNRPPMPLGGAAQGLGLGSTSPTKGTAWLASMPGIRPDPLPLPDYATSAGLSSPNGKAVHRRKTVENEIESLKGSPKVEMTRYRLMDPGVVPKPGGGGQQHQQQVRANRPLPIPGSPPKARPSKDWYI